MLLFPAGPFCVRCADRKHGLWRPFLAVAQDRLKDGERGERRRVGAQDARPQTDRGNKGQFFQPVKLIVLKSTLGTDQDGELVRRTNIGCEAG